MHVLRNHPIKVAIVAGTRPNFIKTAPLLQSFTRFQKQFAVQLIHTGQHYDNNMSDFFFRDLNLPKPNICFSGIGDSQAEQTANIMINFEKYCLHHSPNIILVVGDVNSTLACAIVAKKLNLILAHVEAGLRSFDRTMPEEINRILTDSISDWCFVTESSGVENLLKEGHNLLDIPLVGNVMVDTLLQNLDKARGINSVIALDHYALVTIHRPATVDNPENLYHLISILNEVSQKIPVVFPVHPRTQKRIQELVSIKPCNRIQLLQPQGYLHFINLMSKAKFCLTDSGGVQEETTVLGIPCLTLRKNTERPVTCHIGTNTIVDYNLPVILHYIDKILEGCYKVGTIPEGWDGRAAQRIIDFICNRLLG